MKPPIRSICRPQSSIFALTLLVLFTLFLAACGPKATPDAMLEPPAMPDGVKIVSIVEGSDNVRTVEEIRTYDQCNASSPFKVNISIGQSDSTEVGQELVLSAGVAGQVGISAVAKVAVQGGLEQHYHERKTQTTQRTEGPQIEVPAHTQQEYRLAWSEVRATGVITYIENDETKTANYDYRLGYQLLDSVGKDIECEGQVAETIPTATPNPTNTPDPTDAPDSTNTPDPTFTPVVVQVPPTPTIEPEPVPTKTPEPTFTPKNTDLRIGDCYSKGNVSLCLFVAKFLDPSTFEVELKIENISNNVINFAYGASNVALVDNLGTRYSLGTISQQGFQGSTMLKAGETSSLYNAGVWSWYFVGNFANPSVTNLTIVVSDVSTIDRAEWVFPVYH